MAFIPKKVAHESAEGQRFFRPGEVRPLSIMNTDNRLMANAVRLRVEPLLDTLVSPMQRGFLPGRSLIHNVVEVDTAMRMVSLTAEAPGALFFDFAAAFPSLAHDYLHAVLAHLGLPLSFRYFVDALYAGNGCHISAGGETHSGFSIRAGIRQGCPLSPLLFAVVLDPFLRLLKKLVPEATLAAYADDLALVTQDLAGSVRVVAPAFATFAAVSGLALNLAKTVVIPLGEATPAHVRARFADTHPGWGAAAYQHWAEYLGFTLGPDGMHRGWSKTLTKYKERAALWKQIALGLFFTATAYNVYIGSLLGFVLQLETLPPEWRQIEQSTLRSLVPGPYRWALPEDLHRLRSDYGMPQEFLDMAEVSIAARFRVFHREASAAGGLQVRAEKRRLDAANVASPFIVRGGRWRQWYRSSYVHNLADAVDHCRAQGIDLAKVEATATGHSQRPWTVAQDKRARKQVQRRTRVLLRPACSARTKIRLRHKLARWHLPLHGGRRVERAIAVLGRLRRLVPPRVQAALLRTWFNGWCTKRRFQQAEGSSCMLGCLHGQDSVEHYSTCRHVFAYGASKLRLDDPGEPEARRAKFFLLDREGLRADADLQAMALLQTAIYRLHCRHRHSSLRLADEETASRAIAQAVREAAMGHARALAMLNHRWVRSGGGRS
jgi:hypothetical protein